MKICLLALFYAGTLIGEEVDQTYQLAEKDWEAPVGVPLKVEFEQEILNGKLKFTNDGAWSTGKISRRSNTLKH